MEQFPRGVISSIEQPLVGYTTRTSTRRYTPSPRELEQELIKQLKGPYLVDPSVSVSIMEYRPFYVTGEVKKPGSYPFHPGLTIDRAISIAGGFTERASKGRIFVVHDRTGVEGGGIQKERTKLADVVRPGDVITVEQGFF